VTFLLERLPASSSRWIDIRGHLAAVTVINLVMVWAGFGCCEGYDHVSNRSGGYCINMKLRCGPFLFLFVGNVNESTRSASF
jgi:hypothetical protein